MTEVRENDIVLCTVRKIEGTSVFLEIEGSKIMGSMILSEVAAGRIRNLGDYVSPGKKIVCKALKIYKDHVELSLRRVTAKEREEVLEKNKRENAIKKIIGGLVSNADEIINKIQKDYDLVDFFDEGKENPSVFDKYFRKDEIVKILGMIKEKSEKQRTVRKKFLLKSFSDKGVLDLKEILSVDGEMHYQGSSIFSLSVSSTDFKDAENKLDKILNEIEVRAKKKSAFFEIIREK